MRTRYNVIRQTNSFIENSIEAGILVEMDNVITFTKSRFRRSDTFAGSSLLLISVKPTCKTSFSVRHTQGLPYDLSRRTIELEPTTSEKKTETQSLLMG
jgi:hypothetical protein